MVSVREKGGLVHEQGMGRTRTPRLESGDFAWFEEIPICKVKHRSLI